MFNFILIIHITKFHYSKLPLCIYQLNIEHFYLNLKLLMYIYSLLTGSLVNNLLNTLIKYTLDLIAFNTIIKVYYISKMYKRYPYLQ
jgi:hypothetical protein